LRSSLRLYVKKRERERERRAASDLRIAYWASNSHITRLSRARPKKPSVASNRSSIIFVTMLLKKILLSRRRMSDCLHMATARLTPARIDDASCARKSMANNTAKGGVLYYSYAAFVVPFFLDCNPTQSGVCSGTWMFCFMEHLRISSVLNFFVAVVLVLIGEPRPPLVHPSVVQDHP